jgi:Leucine-rich repeat (LRR) protein
MYSLFCGGGGVHGKSSVLSSITSLYYPFHRPHNKHSNVQLQFISVCRLQQLDMPSRLTVVLLSLLVATPAVIFWLWLVILPARVARLCPETCKCDPAGYYVTCYKSSLNNIPLIFPTNVQQLWLYENNITSLENDSFISRGLTELEEIRLAESGLKTMELGAFNGLQSWRDLLILGNEISEITPGTFKPMSRLQTLFLTGNRIEHLEVDIFSGLIILKFINPKENNLQYLHPDTFAGLPNLVRLDLGYNRNLQIPTDSHFIRSYSLSHLDISGCNVSSVSVETFANVTALERLDLASNNLRSVDINILKALPKLSALYLYGNPLQCDYQLEEVWRWCQDHNIETDFRLIWQECDKRKLSGLLEKLQYLQDFVYSFLHYKVSSRSYDYDPKLLQRYATPLYVVPFIFGTTGNVILLIIITCNKDMRTVPNMYILNLVISDMLYLTVQFGESFADRISYTLTDDDFMCWFFQFWRRLSVGLSAYSVAVLSIQRYRVTVNPLHVRASSQPIWRATGDKVCGVWIVAALFALPSALSTDLCQQCYGPRCLTYYKNVVLFELLVSCVLPLCVIAFFYIMTARHLLKSAQPIPEETQNPRLNTRINTAKIVLGLTVVFLISYVPYHVFWTYVILNKHPFYDEHDSMDRTYDTRQFKIQNGYTYLVSTCLLLINPCLNPVALLCTGRAFRRQFKRYLTCCCKASPPVTNIELTRRN